MKRTLALILALAQSVQAAPSQRGPKASVVPGAGARVTTAPALERDVLVIPASAVVAGERAVVQPREAGSVEALKEAAAERLEGATAAESQRRVESVAGVSRDASGAAAPSAFTQAAPWDKAGRFADDDARRAHETREERVAPYRRENSAVGGMPAKNSLTNYFLYWTKESQDLQRLYRDFVMTPLAQMAAAFSPKNMPYVPGEEFNPFAPMLRHHGEQARRFLKVLEFARRVEANPPQWATRNKVILEERSFKLRDFERPDGKKTDPKITPKLFIPPNSGHLSTIADYEDGKSVVQTALAQGGRVAAIDWQSATPDNIQMIDDMVRNVVDSIDKLGGKVQLVGLCQGGWLAAMVAARYPDKVEAIYTAGAPINTKVGDNDITRVSKNPMEFFNRLVHSMGRDNIYDGETQLLAFLNSGPDGGRSKRVDFWADLMKNIDDPEYVARAEKFARWFYHVNNLSLWYLEAIDKLFKGNDLFEGRFVVHGRVVNLADIRVPVVAMEGSKDDITPAAQASRAELMAMAGPKIWHALKDGGYIDDEGEMGVNRKPGELAVVLDKSLTSSLRQFAADPLLRGFDKARLKAVLEYLQSRDGQNFALLSKLEEGTPRLRRMLPVGHIGLYNSAKSQAYWAEAFAWVQSKL